MRFGNKLKFAAFCFIAAASAFLLAGCSDGDPGKGSAGADTNLVDPVSETNKADSIISLSDAENAALTHAGITADEAEFTKTELDYDDGKAEYEIEFTANSFKYEYDINANDGSILKFSKKTAASDSNGNVFYIESPAATEAPRPAETQKPDTAAESRKPATSTAAQTESLKFITAEEAKTAALNHAGLNSYEVTFTRAKLDYDDGIAEYEIEFNSASDEYEYDINAVTGAVIKYSKEALEIPAMNNTTGIITADEAKSAALAHAGLSASEVTFTKARLDYDDGTAEYEIEFNSVSDKYEYDINASNGNVIKYSKESLKNSNQNGSSMITADEAKNIALEYAELNASEVRFTKSELDYDDGRAEYEIEFSFGRKEYEFKIDAYTGEIVETDIE